MLFVVIWQDPELVPVEILKDFPLGQAKVRFAVGTTDGGVFLPGDGVPPGAVAPDGDSVVVCSDAVKPVLL